MKARTRRAVRGVGGAGRGVGHALAAVARGVVRGVRGALVAVAHALAAVARGVVRGAGAVSRGVGHALAAVARGLVAAARGVIRGAGAVSRGVGHALAAVARKVGLTAAARRVATWRVVRGAGAAALGVRGRLTAAMGRVRTRYAATAMAFRAQPRRRLNNQSAVPALLASLCIALPLAGVLFALNAGSSVKDPNVMGPGARAAQAFGGGPLDLPAATAAPAPSPPSLAAVPNLQPHEVFGFAPYWALPQASGFDLHDLSTVAYFSVDVNGDGSINESGPGWMGYQSQDLVNLINQAHAQRDRVVLAVTCFDQHSLDQLSSNPTAPARLAGQLTNLLSAKSLDGANLDFEGNGGQDRAGIDSLVAGVSGRLHGVNPHWQVTMDTYGTSAGDPNGFFDIPGLAPSVDGFFVMAYDMDDSSTPSPNAALDGPGNSDTNALTQYTSVVPPSKIVLGVPFYGYDWPTSGPALGSPATGPPSPVTYSQIAAMRAPAVYWDQASQTPWTAYQTGNQWHEVFFDNPTSVALKARLASSMHIAGVGIWSLGMDGNDPAMIQALLGSSQAMKYQVGPTQVPGAAPSAAPAPPGSPSPQGGPPPPPPSGGAPPQQYSYSGTWNGHQENLQPVDPNTLPGGGNGTNAGQLTGFQTNDPAASCLSHGPPLTVTELSSAPSDYVVRASTPNDCTNGTWMFNAPPSGSSSPLPSLPGTSPQGNKSSL